MHGQHTPSLTTPLPIRRNVPVAAVPRRGPAVSNAGRRGDSVTAKVHRRRAHGGKKELPMLGRVAVLGTAALFVVSPCGGGGGGRAPPGTTGGAPWKNSHEDGVG